MDGEMARRMGGWRCQSREVKRCGRGEDGEKM